MKSDISENCFCSPLIAAGTPDKIPIFSLIVSNELTIFSTFSFRVNKGWMSTTDLDSFESLHQFLFVVLFQLQIALW